MAEGIEGGPHASGVDLQISLYVLQSTDVGVSRLPEGNDGALDLVHVGHVDADPASVPEVRIEIGQGEPRKV